jgi:hypothetical protein
MGMMAQFESSSKRSRSCPRRRFTTSTNVSGGRPCLHLDGAASALHEDVASTEDPLAGVEVIR